MKLAVITIISMMLMVGIASAQLIAPTTELSITGEKGGGVLYGTGTLDSNGNLDTPEGTTQPLQNLFAIFNFDQSKNNCNTAIPYTACYEKEASYGVAEVKTRIQSIHDGEIDEKEKFCIFSNSPTGDNPTKEIACLDTPIGIQYICQYPLTNNGQKADHPDGQKAYISTNPPTCDGNGCYAPDISEIVTSGVRIIETDQTIRDSIRQRTITCWGRNFEQGVWAMTYAYVKYGEKPYPAVDNSEPPGIPGSDFKKDVLICTEALTCSNELLKVCGDYVLDSGEQCDDGNRINGDGCSSTCILEGSPQPGLCGNGRIDRGEQCDKTRVTQTCTTLGLGDGQIACNRDCTFDTRMCDVVGSGTPITGGFFGFGNLDPLILVGGIVVVIIALLFRRK